MYYSIMLPCRMRPRNIVCRPGFKSFSSLLAMTPISRCAVSSPRLTMLASPDSAGGGLGRARAVSRLGVLFFAVLQEPICIFDSVP